MGAGRLSLRGSRGRPWLELRQLELKRTYLEHQLRRLRRLHDGPLEAHIDVLPGEGFYDIHRVRLTTPALHRAYELLHPRDERRLSAEVLAITGWMGMAALWIDQGRWPSRTRPTITGRFSLEEYGVLDAWLEAQGIARVQPRRQDRRNSLVIAPDAIERFMAALRPHVHRSQRWCLRPGRPGELR